MSDSLPPELVDGAERLLRRLAADLRVEHAWMVVSTADGDTVLGHAPTSDDPRHFDDLLDRVAERAGVTVIDDLATDSVSSSRSAVERAGAFLGLMARNAQGEPMGIVAALSPTARAWTNRDLERADDNTHLLGSLFAINRLRLHSERRIAEEARSRALRTRLHRIATETSAATSLAELGKIIVADATGMLGCEWAAVASRLDNDTRWKCAVSDGPARTTVLDYLRSDAGSRLIEQVEGDGHRTLSPDLYRDLTTLLSPQASMTLLGTRVTPAQNNASVVFLAAFVDKQLGLRVELLLDELISDAGQVADRIARTQRATRTAATLQRSLLPPRLPTIEGLDIRRLYNSAADHSRVGGDWYDVVEIDDDVTGFVVGDVAGHDLRSAAVMGQLRHVLASQLHGHDLPAEALMATDRYFAGLAENVMATAVVFVFDRRAGSMRIASAGHPPPVLIDGGGARLVSFRPGAPLGLGFETQIDHTVAIEPGAIVVAYTDGVVERRRGDISRHLDELVAELAEVPPDVDQLISHLNHRSQLSELVDDVAALVVRFGS